MPRPAPLTESDIQQFNARQTRLGLAVDQFNHSDDTNTADFNGELILSADPTISNIEPIFVPYNSISELKGLIGTPNSIFHKKQMSDRFIPYPEAPPADRISLLSNTKDDCDFDWHASHEEAFDLRTAAESYIMGNSEKLAAWEPMLNARFGVGRVAVFAGKNFTVGKDQTIVIKPDVTNPDGLVVLNYQTVTVEEGGQFVIAAKVKMTTDTFTVND